MAGEAGRKVLIKVDDNDTGGGSATWKTVGLQTGGSHGRTTETADGSYKVTGTPWTEAVATAVGWTVSVEGLLLDNDTALAYMRTKHEAAAAIWVQVDKSAMTNGVIKEGQAIITSLDEEYARAEVVSYTAEFQGTGSLVTSP
jgi:hypothetical protein